MVKCPHTLVSASVQELFKDETISAPQTNICDSRSVRLELFLGHHVPRQSNLFKNKRNEPQQTLY